MSVAVPGAWEALRHPLITDAYRVVATYRVFIDLDDGPFEVVIRIDEDEHGRFYGDQSTFVQTPLQGDPYRPAVQGYATPEEAMERMKEAILAPIMKAVGETNRSTAAWMVPNRTFWAA